MAGVRDRPCTRANAIVEWSTRVVDLRAVVCTVLINEMLPKHERQHQQPRRPCDQHSQQEPLIRFHCSVPPVTIPMITRQKVTSSIAFHRSPYDETAGPHQFRCARILIHCIHGHRSVKFPCIFSLCRKPNIRSRIMRSAFAQRSTPFRSPNGRSSECSAGEEVAQGEEAAQTEAPPLSCVAARASTNHQRKLSHQRAAPSQSAGIP